MSVTPTEEYKKVDSVQRIITILNTVNFQGIFYYISINNF